ncbi:MAG TPA: hypothetical protein VNK49_11035 [Anaerolineales bacterium]|nr:hypothetical protein [Anaerolineales bacterium]
MKTLRPLFFFSTLLLIIGMACAALGGGATQPPQPPTQPPVQQPTQPPQEQPTPLPPTEEQTEAPAAEAFFTEEFDTNDNWTYFVVDGSRSEITDEDIPTMDLFTENSLLTFDLRGNNLWVYVTYDPFEYEDVRIDAHVINRGVNNNNVSLICRYTDSGWYEFNIANNGLYWIFAASVDASGKVSYGLVYNGGSNDIKAGKATNDYTAICKGRTLSLFINGREARTVTDNKYALSSGKVGVSVSSFDTLPVTVDIDWVTISEP